MAKQTQAEKRSLEVAEAARQKEWESPSFAGELFMGRLNTELVFPFPEQEQEDRQVGDEILAALKSFLVAKVDADRIDREKEIPAEVVEGLREMGLFGIKVPKEYGGLGLSQTNYNRIIQLIGSHCASTAVLLSAHQSIGVPQPLKLFGTEDQKKTYLPRIAAGEVSAFALTEPDVGSDPSHMTTLARLSEDGSEYLISGKKLWTTNGPMADLLIVMARTNDPEEETPEITAFIVEGKSEGLSVGHRCDFMGLKGIQNGLILFDEVRVPKENILLGVGEGLRLALKTLNTGRLTLPAACGSVMRAALSMAVRWGKDRHQWGAPVGKHEAVASKLATLAAESYAVESLTWLTSAMAEAGKADIRIEAAMAKLFCTEALWRGVDSALQVRGGRGFETADSLQARGELPMPLERMLRDARINLIIEGTSEIMRLFIAREALDPHLKAAGASATSGKIDYLKAFKFYSAWYPKLWVPRLGKSEARPVLPPPLAGHLRFVERATRRLARDLFHVMGLYRDGLQKKEMLLARLVDTGVELFAMCAVISRAGTTKSQPGAEALADLFCRQARRRVSELHKGVYCNDDRKTYKVARQVLNDDFPWLEENILSAWKGEDE